MTKPVGLLMAVLAFAVVGLLAVESAATLDKREEIFEFAKKPRVSKEGDGYVISFASKGYCDATVTIMDGKGRIVRHLASGVLGPNAPSPFKKNALAQTIFWDARDDDGRRLSAGNYQVRVGLGLRPRFDRILGYNPHKITGARALATGPGGELYVFHVSGALHPSEGTTQCAVFSREGRYLRTILPYPANLPERRLRGLQRLEIGPDRWVPFIYQVETRSLVPGAGELHSHRAVVAKDGRVAFVGIHELGRYAQPGEAYVTVIRTDGSAPRNVIGPKLSNRARRCAGLALSPDQKTIYASGLKEKNPTHVVYRCRWDDAEAKPFLGTPGEPGDGQDHFNQPVGVATDREGNIYVADRGNNRIAVFSASGNFLGALSVERPEMVEVHPRSGAVYVLGGAHKEWILKFSGWKEGKELARIRIPYFTHGEFAPVMALDASAEPALVWVASHHAMRYAGYNVLRLEDRGDSFSQPLELTNMGTRQVSAGPVLDIGVDRHTERLYLGRKGFDLCLDGRTGKLLDFTPPRLGGSGKTAIVGEDGYIYLYWDYPAATLSRYDLTGKPVWFPGLGTDRMVRVGNPRLRGRGLAVTRAGNIYVLQQKVGAQKSQDDARDANALYLYGPDGKLKREKLVDSQMRSMNSVRVDSRGNIYLALGLRPGKELLPPGLKGKIPADKKLAGSVKGVNYYPLMYGSMVKFQAEGGLIRENVGGIPCNYGYGNPIEVKGAKWIFSGASPVPSWRTPGTPDICLCESPRFDVDGFGRVFFPDVGRFRVGVLDTNGNLVTWFGGYGNRDSAGPGSAVPVPEIPLTWGHIVAVSDEAAYVGDRLACRVVRVKLDYHTQENIPLP